MASEIEKKTGCLTAVCDWSSIIQEMVVEAQPLLSSEYAWNNLSGLKMRNEILLPLSLSLVLLNSRALGHKFSKKVVQCLLKLISDSRNPNGKLHIICHGLGSNLLLDALFSSKWTVEKTQGNEDPVYELRSLIKGLGSAYPQKGLELETVHFMGTNLTYYQWIHLFEPVLNRQNPFAYNYQDYRAGISAISSRYKTRWYNFLYSGDLLAFPAIEDEALRFSNRMSGIQNIIIRSKFSMIVEMIQRCIGKPVITSFFFSSSHQKYWSDKRVTSRISQTIVNTV